jgi:hypothetical protein
VYIQWQLRNGTQAIGYNFTVYRAGSPSGPWEPVVAGLTDVYYFLDDTYPAPTDRTEPALMSLHNVIYYKVHVTNSIDGEAEASQIIEGGLDRRRRSMVKKLRRDAWIKIRKGSGTEVAVLKRRWWGTECDCKTKTGVVTRAHCSKCNGTGIIDGHGYWNPTYTFGKRSASNLMAQTTSEGKTEANRILVTIPYIPRVEPEDVLVFLRDDKRFMVENVSLTELHSVTVHQELQVTELAKSAREYNMLVDNWHDPQWF